MMTRLLPAARERARWFCATHSIGPTATLALLAGWVAAALLTRVGIPAVDPTLQPVPRPMETLGTVALCLPAGFQATLLKDGAPWLVDAAPRAAWRLRIAWLATVQLAGAAPALLWLLTLPPAVPRLHAFALWLLVSAVADLAVPLIGSDWAVIPPLVLMAAVSFSRLVPFDRNAVYNVALTQELLIIAVVMSLAAAATFARQGSRNREAALRT